MQISSRFTEYGLTGGFFWICQLTLIWWSGRAQTILSELSRVQIPAGISQVGSTALTSLIGALAIIAVFVAGLLLDLLAVYFRPMEIRVFNRHLVRNRDWLSRVITNHKDYCGADYDEFERRYGDSSMTKDFWAGFAVSVLWNRQRRQQWLDALRRNWSWNLARPYERLWSFFSSYVVVMSGSSQLSLMVDQYYLWRTGRAVSAALLIIFFEIQFAAVFFGGTPNLPSEGFMSVVGVVLPLGLTVLTAAITLGTYSRLCFTLFALVYVTQDKREVELKPATDRRA